MAEQAEVLITESRGLGSTLEPTHGRREQTLAMNC